MKQKPLRTGQHLFTKKPTALSLIYIDNNTPGILREKSGDSFTYLHRGKPVTDEVVLERIKKLAIPPAWTRVWICPKPNGHIQATGYDARNRKQYRYHTAWNLNRNQDKFNKLLKFGEILPLLRKKIEVDLSQNELTEQKVIATVISLMEKTYIRIGNSSYEKENGSYGLTTLKDKHVQVNGHAVDFSFKGKKGIYHRIQIRNRKLARIVKQCRDMPGKELFQYLDPQGNRHSIDSGTVNNYIKSISGDDFTAKDFRTWAGSINALRALKECNAGESKEKKSEVLRVLDCVSKKLGNTRNVCRKYYVHPKIIELFENNELSRFTENVNEGNQNGKDDLEIEEKILMKILSAA